MKFKTKLTFDYTLSFTKSYYVFCEAESIEETEKLFEKRI